MRALTPALGGSAISLSSFLFFSFLFLAACASPLLDRGELHPGSLEELLVRVELARGLRAERPVDARVVDSAEVRRIVKRTIIAERGAGEIEAYQAGLVTVGLWPPDRNIVDEYARVMGDEVAGMYLPAENALYVVSDSDEPFSVWLSSALARRDWMTEFALTHELVHLLQHGHYPVLLEDNDFYFSQDDAGLAAQIALEGDATYYGLVALGAPLPTPAAFAASFAEGLAAAREDPDRAPALIAEVMAVPYIRGYELATAEGKQLLESPPASTEQALHPERRREAFWNFDLTAVRAALPEGCAFVSENSVGELQIKVLFEDLSEGPVDESVWAGWDGDRYLAARCESGPVLFWLTTWDSGADAQEFASAYLDMAPAVMERAGFFETLRVRLLGRDVIISNETLAAFEEQIDDLVVRSRVRSLAELREVVAAR